MQTGALLERCTTQYNSKRMNILTFDIEEWFHILDNESTKTSDEWKSYESRIHRNMDRLFAILENTKSKATFFILGWIAEKYPEIIRSIRERGFEIGCHSYYHQLVYEQSPESFQKDLDKSIKRLEDITGEKVKYYRAPGFSITESEKWAFETLHKYGIEVDCSIFPAPRAHGGFRSYNTNQPALISYNGINLKEYPISVWKIFGRSVVYTGGGYFRITPYPILSLLTKKSQYTMTYFHPRDIDPDQPIIQDLPLFRKFKSYVGLKGAEKKMLRYLTQFNFIDIKTAIKHTDWKSAPVIDL